MDPQAYSLKKRPSNLTEDPGQAANRIPSRFRMDVSPESFKINHRIYSLKHLAQDSLNLDDVEEEEEEESGHHSRRHKQFSPSKIGIKQVKSRTRRNKRKSSYLLSQTKKSQETINKYRENNNSMNRLGSGNTLIVNSDTHRTPPSNSLQGTPEVGSYSNSFLRKNNRLSKFGERSLFLVQNEMDGSISASSSNSLNSDNLLNRQIQVENIDATAQVSSSKTPEPSASLLPLSQLKMSSIDTREGRLPYLGSKKKQDQQTDFLTLSAQPPQRKLSRRRKQRDDSSSDGSLRQMSVMANSEIDGVYEQSAEYYTMQEKIRRSQLQDARRWVCIVLSYYVIRTFMFMLVFFDDQSTKVLFFSIQAFKIMLIGGALAFSWKCNNLEVIPWLLYVQAILMVSSKWVKTDAESTDNFEGINLFSAVFSVIFIMSNLFLASLLVVHQRLNLILTSLIIVACILTLTISNFEFESLELIDVAKILVVFLYSGVLVVAFGFLSNRILQSQIQEARALFLQRGEYKKMFDSLQEGIIVIQDDDIDFMNELSNAILTSLSGGEDFFLSPEGSMDATLFYEFVFTQGEGGGSSKKRLSTANIQSHFRHSESTMLKPFSLRDLADLSAGQLASKMFTFDPRLALTNDFTDKEGGLNLSKVVRELKCTRGIEEEFLPQFRFIQIKKSCITNNVTADSKTMLCFSDISQKILYDTSKAEKDLLSLINSTISHEMRNPLNSIINQCKIHEFLLKRLSGINQVKSSEVIKRVEEVTKHLSKGNRIQTSSSNLLLMNVEDILGFAQLKAGKFQKNIAKFSVRRAVEDIISIQAYQAEAKNIRLEYKLLSFPLRWSSGHSLEVSVKSSEGGNKHNYFVESDEKRIKQVLINLQSNALKFTKEGGFITIYCEYIRGVAHHADTVRSSQHEKSKLFSLFNEDIGLEFENEDLTSEEIQFEQEHNIIDVFKPALGRDKLVFAVVDTGIGIKPKDKIKLFRLFGCLKNTRQMNTNGIGLGLVICENIVKAFDGTMGVESAFNFGSKFCFSIQLQGMTELSQQEASEMPKSSISQSRHEIQSSVFKASALKQQRWSNLTYHPEDEVQFELVSTPKPQDLQSQPYKPRISSFSDARICNREEQRYHSLQMSKERLRSAKRNEEEKAKRSEVFHETQSSVNDLSVPSSCNEDLNFTQFGDHSSAINLISRNGVGFTKLMEEDPNSRGNTSFQQQQSPCEIQQLVRLPNQFLLSNEEGGPNHLYSPAFGVENMRIPSIHECDIEIEESAISEESKEPEKEVSQPQFTVPSLGDQTKARKRSILVVDDEKFNRDIIEGFLMVLGFDDFETRMVEASDGQEAIDRVQEAISEKEPDRFALILMDCNMPFMDGYTASKQIRRMYEGRLKRLAPVIVAITGHVEQEYIDKALKSGMDRVFPKPFPIKDFASLLLELELVDSVPEEMRADTDD